MSQKSIALTQDAQREAYREARAFVEDALADDESITDGELARFAFQALVGAPDRSGAGPLVTLVDDLETDPSTPTCRNCGSQVTKKYVEVFTDASMVEGPPACPHCEDMIHRTGGYREKR